MRGILKLRAKLHFRIHLLLGFLLASGLVQAAESSPNIIFILTDDQGWADFGESIYSGHEDAFCGYFETPVMNRLASQGLTFTNAYAPAPNCTPTRRSILFGMTPARQKGTEFIGYFNPEGHLAIPQYLKQVDPTYTCAIFGKWGEVMDGTWKNENQLIYPEALGFDFSDGRHTGNVTGNFYHRNLGKEQERRNYFVEPDQDPKRTISVTNRAIDFLEEQSKNECPFYMQVNYYAIHTAHQALPETIEKYASKPNPDRRVLRGVGPSLDDLDTSIGQILKAVEDLNLASETYVVLSSDNGGEGYFNPPWANSTMPDRNAPLRLYKGFLYEGGIRVPLVIRGPGIEPCSFSRVPVSLVDLLPTFYELAGGSGSLPEDIDGSSLLPVIQYPEVDRLDRGQPGLIFHRPFFPKQSHSALRAGDFKLVVTWGNKRWKIQKLELFNLHEDIGELNNLAQELPEKAEAMKTALVDYLKRVDARMPGK